MIKKVIYYVMATLCVLWLVGLESCQKDEGQAISKYSQESKDSINETVEKFDLQKFKVPSKENFNTSGRDNIHDRPSFDILDHICNQILSQDSQYHFLDTFLLNYGYPDWYNSFYLQEERGNQIIYIPFTKNNTVTGVLQYHTVMESNGFIFFSKGAALELIKHNLEGQNLELTAIFTNVIAQQKCFNKLEAEDLRLLNWLNIYSDNHLNNSDGGHNRVRNCFVYCGLITTEHFNDQVGQHFTTDWDCVTICYETSTYTPLSINGYYFGTGPYSNITNYTSTQWWNIANLNLLLQSTGNGGHGSGTGSDGTNNDTRSWEETIQKEAEDCIKAMGIKGVMAEAKLKEKANHLCGTTYEELRAQAYMLIIKEQGKQCGDVTAYNEFINELDNMIENNTEWASPELKTYLDELTKNGSIVDPCNPYLTTEQIIDKAKNGLCDKKGASVEDFEEELGKEEYISTMHLDKRTKCIYDLTIKSNNLLICEELKQFKSDKPNKLNLQFSIDKNALFEDANGQFSEENWDPSINKYQVDIVLNGKYIDNNCDLFIMKTLVHESIHATIWAIFNNLTLDKLKIETFYPGYIEYLDKYGNEADHEYMAAKKLSDIVNILKEIYGSKYSTEELETLVWSGLNRTTAFKAKFNTPNKVSEWETKL